jgi:hypothetical protein
MRRNLYDFGSMQFDQRRPDLLEAFSGTSIVAWQGRIERQLHDLINEYEEANNPVYVDKLRAILQHWKTNQLTGSVNVETIDSLVGPVELAAADSWKLQDYFSKLKDSLKVLHASLEELPPGPEPQPAGMERNMMPSGGGDLPPISDFGPDKDAPPGGEEPPAEGEAEEGEETPEAAGPADELADEIKST